MNLAVSNILIFLGIIANAIFIGFTVIGIDIAITAVITKVNAYFNE